MKYLKLFNEQFHPRPDSEYIQELQDFCNNCLAYLIDESYEIKYETNPRNFPEVHYNTTGGVNIELYKGKHFNNHAGNYGIFDWLSVKDYYIPFLQLISIEYEIMEYHTKKGHKTVCLQGDEYVYYDIEDLISDKIDDEDQFYSISIKVGRKL